MSKTKCPTCQKNDAVIMMTGPVDCEPCYQRKRAPTFDPTTAVVTFGDVELTGYASGGMVSGYYGYTPPTMPYDDDDDDDDDDVTVA